MSKLFSSVEIGPLTLRNRLVVAPMAQYSADHGAHTDWHRTHLGGLANSGAGLVIIEMTSPTMGGRCSHGDAALCDDRTEQALSKTVSLMRRVGTAKIGIQIGHGGRKAAMLRPWEGSAHLGPGEGAWEIVAPTPLALGNSPVPREMSLGDIQALVGAHADAAVRAVRAGVELIEIHAAHGYLLHQFHSPITNRRGDNYGGSAGNRMRLLLDVFEATRAAAPCIAVGMRITASDWIEGGLEPADAVALAKALETMGCDFVDVTSGGLDPRQKIVVGPLYQVEFAAAVKAAVSIPVQTAGLIVLPEHAEQIVAAGQADTVALARAFIANPRWGWWAALRLDAEAGLPPQTLRAGHPLWPGWAIADPQLQTPL